MVIDRNEKAYWRVGVRLSGELVGSWTRHDDEASARARAEDLLARGFLEVHVAKVVQFVEVLGPAPPAGRPATTGGYGRLIVEGRRCGRGRRDVTTEARIRRRRQAAGDSPASAGAECDPGGSR